MQITVTSPSTAKTPFDTALVIPVFENAPPALIDTLFNKKASVVAQKHLASEHFSPELGTVRYLVDLPHTPYSHIVFLGLGEKHAFNGYRWKKALLGVTDLIGQWRPNNLAIALPDFPSMHESCMTLACLAGVDLHYQFAHYKTDSPPRTGFENLHIIPSMTMEPDEQSAMERKFNALAKGMSLARDLANSPANHCTPHTFVHTALTLSEQYPDVTSHILDEVTMDKLGMGALLAVAKGSQHPPYLCVLNYQGTDANTPPYVFIGKGVTFDSGGITLKSAPGMHNMIYDMAGAAAVTGLIQTVAEYQLPLNISVLVPTVENMTDGGAYRPGDVITTLSGQTVEVISTDAEGRLILCDALTYALSLSPKVMIDVATLTGAAITALGHVASGLMSNTPSLARALCQAGDTAHDTAWEMPLWDDYDAPLASTCADMRNAGTNAPGMITAASFLKQFVAHTPWAHLDVAGTSFTYGKGGSATARPLPLLFQYLLDQAHCDASPPPKVVNSGI
ncbi:leucyl aminopeptidase [Alteromonas sp. 14N.309.X.WAT.G.H12]|uniref:leucyl aminopeptidase n=1 Tax=Alteromonas sp. 14N.309.X.WAT.G.H12 TaxID=3120824 RepID=UPI002FD6029D